MNTGKKNKTSSLSADIASKDIEAMLEYRDKLEVLHQEAPAEQVTQEEWDDFFSILDETGQFPEKYRGRVGIKEEEVYTDTINGKLAPVPEGKKKTIYYDIAFEEINAKYYNLQREYHNSIIKALQAYFDSTKGKEDGTQAASIIAIIRELEKQVKAAQKSTLAPIGSVPNGEIFYWLIRTLNSSKGGRMVEQSSGNRHEKITILQKGNSLIFIRENKQTKATQIVEIKNALKYLGKTKTFVKLLIFTLQKMTAQNFPLEVGFSLQELVDLGMYSTTSNAWRAVKSFYEQQLDTPLSGTVKKGKKTVKEEEGVLFYHRKVDNNFITLYVNENLNTEFIANYFTVFPRFAYALSNNAFSLVWYIFYLARQNAQAIKDKGTFTISLEKVREHLGLPSVEEVKNRGYKEDIIDKIETAITDIEDALQNVPEAKECSFTITPYGTDTSNIREWLQGYLEIGLKGDFAETFVKLAEKAEQDRKQWERIKKAERAKIAARAEAKEAQDEPKRTTRKRK